MWNGWKKEMMTKMKSELIFGCAALTVVAAFAKLTEEEKQKLREERLAYDEKIYRQNGGEAVKPAKGFVAIVNGQKQVASDVLEAAAKALVNQTQFAFRVVDADTKNATMTVRVVDVAGKPPLLVAPEEGWAEINVAALASDLKDKAKAKFLPERVKKMVVRGYVLAAGAGSAYPENLMDIVTVKDLDYRELVLPVDAVARAQAHAFARGLTQYEKTTYRQACSEGWAPAPTNDIQKAIWDKVHELPTKPIKIEYNEKRDKGK